MPAPNPLPATAPLETLLRESPHLWRGRGTTPRFTQATGFELLDARLPGGGWPVGALIELLPAVAGLGELSLTLPALRSLCHEGRTVALVSPPYIPYAPALVSKGLPLKSVLWIDTACDEDGRWAAEQLLREGAAAVLLWSRAREDRALRRLQLAAEAGRSCAFLYRDPRMLREASPAALRLALYPAAEGVRAEIIKVRGGQPGSVTLPLRSAPT